MGSSAPMRASTLPVMLRASSGCTVERPEWKPTTALRSAPPRASSKESVPPKQKPMAARRPGSQRGSARRMSRPAVPMAKAPPGRTAARRCGPSSGRGRRSASRRRGSRAQRRRTRARRRAAPPEPNMIVEPGTLVQPGRRVAARCHRKGTASVPIMVRPSDSYVMSLVVAMGAPYLPPVEQDWRRCAETWPAAALGIGRRRRRSRPIGAGGLRLGFTDTDLLPAPPGIHHHDDRRRPHHDGPAAALGPVPGRAHPSHLPFWAAQVTAAESPYGTVFAAPLKSNQPATVHRLGDRRQRAGADR